MNADPKPRPDTPLALQLKERIRREGPMTVAQFMQACLHDPEHGYYRRRAAIGAAGDFITAPEISQAFGELIGLWCAVVWQQMGSPERVSLIELGPGRGTMMRDALRAARLVPRFQRAAAVHLVESHAGLRAMQQETLRDSGSPIAWHEQALQAFGRNGAIGPHPAIVLANEFLDAQGITQHVYEDGRWHERTIGLDVTDHLVFGRGMPIDACAPALAPPADAQDGDIFEQCSDPHAVAGLLADFAGRAPLAALFIDYGHARTQLGDTLQAVAGHGATCPLRAPGEVDLSAQVDFQAFARTCLTAGGGNLVCVDGPVSQAEFLGTLGIVERASRLMAANPAKATTIEAGVARLIAPGGMGTRFKAIGIRSASLPALPGFPAQG